MNESPHEITPSILQMGTLWSGEPRELDLPSTALFLKETLTRSLLYPFTLHHTFCPSNQFSSPRLLEAFGGLQAGHSSPPLVPSHWLFLSCLKFSRSLKNISFFSILFPSSPLALNTTYLFTLDLCREIQTRITNCVLDIFHLFNRQLQPNVQNITLNCLPHTSFSYAYIFLISGNATTST